MTARRCIVNLDLCAQHHIQLLGEGWGMALDAYTKPTGICALVGCTNKETRWFTVGAFLVNAKGNRFQIRNAYAIKEAPSPTYPDLKR